MKVVLSWLKDYVDITLPLPKLVHELTMAGLEVEGVQIVGLPVPEHSEIKMEGLAWDPAAIVVAAITEVAPHPNADRLVLCQLDDGLRTHTVLTGAPNLYPYKGAGPLPKPIKVAYAKEGARIYDGHQPGLTLTTLKRAKIRGVESYSMVCSEKELGISDEHDGVIFLDDDAPVGAPLVDYMGDAVIDIAILPNIARALSHLGVAREIAALTGQALHEPDYRVQMDGPAIQGRALIDIRTPELNPRFVLGLAQGVEIGPSPYWMQRRLRLAGMRPINNIVDATNYAMLDVGEPLHAFDYDVLVQRAGGKAPTIITRTAAPGERLTTLDGVGHTLDDFTVLVCDTAGPLSIAGVMGGAESEVTPATRNVLLEGAAWNFINIRRTAAAQKMTSEAALRFSRGVHPAMAERGVRRCLDLFRRNAGAAIAQGLVDAYPLPPAHAVVEITTQDVRRYLGLDLSAEQMAEMLGRLGFDCVVQGLTVHADAPDHRLDIGEGLTGVADLMEEIARVYGYERIPATSLSAALPAQRGEPALEAEERMRDVLVGLGFQEAATYRLTSPEREARRLPEGAPADEMPYVTLANPIAADRVVMRHSLLASLLEAVERNSRVRPRIALFEIAPIYLASEAGALPDELPRLALALTGQRELAAWQPADTRPMDFFDLKGALEAFCDALHIVGLRFEPAEHPTFHPGKCARLWVDDTPLGVMGAMHPLVRRHYDLPDAPVLLADLDVNALRSLSPESHPVRPSPAFPPVLEDLAVIVDDALPAERVEAVIRQAGGKLLAAVRLFDLYRGAQVGEGKKSLAYSLTYQSYDKTLTDDDAQKLRQRVIRALEKELEAKVRSK